MIQTPLRAFRGRGLAHPLKNVDAVAVVVGETRKKTVDSMMMQTRMKMTMQGWARARAGPHRAVGVDLEVAERSQIEDRHLEVVVEAVADEGSLLGKNKIFVIQFFNSDF